MLSRLRVRSLVLVPVLLVAATAPALAEAGADFWNVRDARAELAAVSAESAALDDRDDAVLQRIAIKEDLVAALIAGRAGLAEVAARFRELNEHEPTYRYAIRTTVPGDSDAERAARNVIDYATHRVAAPARADLCRRLEAELARMPHADHPAVR